jgi:hypothetical protein
LLRHAVGRVLVVRRQVDVFVDAGRAVDVVLVRAHLVRPRPLVQVRRRREVVEPAVPQHGGVGQARGHKRCRGQKCGFHDDGDEELGWVLKLIEPRGNTGRRDGQEGR